MPTLYEKERKKQVSTNLTPDEVEQLDTLVYQKGYYSRSAYLADVVRREIAGNGK